MPTGIVLPRQVTQMNKVNIQPSQMKNFFTQSTNDQFRFNENRCILNQNSVEYINNGSLLTLSPIGVDCAGAELRSRLLFNPIGTFCSRSEAYALVNGLRWTQVGALAGSVLGIFLMSDWQAENWKWREWDFAEIYDNSPSRSIATNPDVFTNYIVKNPGDRRDDSQSLLGYSPGTEIRACLSLTTDAAKFTVNGKTRDYPIPADRPNDQPLRWFINAYSPKGWADDQNVKNTVQLLLNEVCYDPDPTVANCLLHTAITTTAELFSHSAVNSTSSAQLVAGSDNEIDVHHPFFIAALTFFCVAFSCCVAVGIYTFITKRAQVGDADRV